MGGFLRPIPGAIQAPDMKVPGSLLQGGAGYLGNLPPDIPGGIGKSERSMVPDDGISGDSLLGVWFGSIGILAPGSIGKGYLILEGGAIPGGSPGYLDNPLL